ncbi:MAG: WYL domain-containing protein [Chloroflexi bacterium]|nr:WYL domain-containing protein [Chloroflexota bacterium]
MLPKLAVQTSIISTPAKDKLQQKMQSHQEVSTHLLLRQHQVTPYSLTLTLAYLHYYTPKRLPNGRFLAPNHLRILACWIGKPAPKLRSIRQHRWLATHFTLLHAAGFLTTSGETIIPQPHITRWLHLPYPAHISYLQQAIKKSGCWQKAITYLSLQNSIGEDVLAYLQQSLHHQHQTPSPIQPDSVIWLNGKSRTNADSRINGKTPENWRFHIPNNIPLWLHFDLRQLGSWSPGQPLICTPLSIATAVQRGYGNSIIQWLLETATQCPLSVQQQTQLIQWSQRADAYQLRPVQLLSTKQRQQMQAIFGRKILRDEIIEQISPRHAIVATGMVAKLEKHLLKQNYPLSHLSHSAESKGKDESTSMQWLGVRVLMGLGELIPLSIPPPHSQLHQLGSQLTDLERMELEVIATHILQNLRNAIRGRDAFFPSQKSVPPEWIQTISRAINNEDILEIMYQPLGDTKPSHRCIQPLRLEESGTLFYMYAYCYRTEMNLTFRLDRISQIK